jgi:NADH:ubiquinone reductase (H+-translocating)
MAYRPTVSSLPAADAAQRPPRVVVIGAGFAGYHAVQTLQKFAPRVEVVLINPTDYLLYLPLLPEVAAGLLDPRRICVSLRRWPGRVRLQLGAVDTIDLDRREVGWTDPEGRPGEITYDRLLITVGSVNKLLPIPGVADSAHGFRGIAEALYLRDHLVRQLELAVAADQAERDARCTFVVVGAGYTGTEVAAQGQLLTRRMLATMPALAGQRLRWLLVDNAPTVLPGLDPRLARTTDRVLRRRGIEVRTGQSITEARADAVRLTTGEVVPTRSLIWCVGVRPDPLVEGLGLPTNRGRLVVDELMAVPGRADLFACGDCAATPDLTRPGEITGMTAQHAQRQGRRAARNVVASLGLAPAKPYKHHDLGFLVDLGGVQAAANPLGVSIRGLPAKAVTRGYHLLALPGNRMRTAIDWGVNLFHAPPAVQLGLVRSDHVRLVHTAVADRPSA